MNRQVMARARQQPRNWLAVSFAQMEAHRCKLNESFEIIAIGCVIGFPRLLPGFMRVPEFPGIEQLNTLSYFALHHAFEFTI